MTAYKEQNTIDQEEVYDLEAKKQQIAKGTEDIKKELSAQWQKRYANAQIFPDTLKQINSTVIDFLLSFENTLFHNQLAKKFNLNEKQRDIIPQIVWQICIDKNWDYLEEAMITAIKIPQAQALAREINVNIISKIKSLSEKNSSPQKRYEKQEEQISIEKNTLTIALNKYPEINDQLITANRIDIKKFSEPARPSVGNWLSDYTFNMGFDTHDSAARGIYLFRNENTKKLNAGDRAKLGYILKAFDTNELIEINLNLKQIIFPKLTLAENKLDSNLQGKIPSPVSPVGKTEAEPLKDIFQRKMPFFQKTPAKPKLSGTFTISRQIPAEIPPAKLPLPVPETPTALRKISTPIFTNKPRLEFTSPQKLPFESQQIQPTVPKKPAQPIMNRPLEKTAPMSNPIRITPTHFKRTTPLKNVVDLKK